MDTSPEWYFLFVLAPLSCLLARFVMRLDLHYCGTKITVSLLRAPP